MLITQGTHSLEKEMLRILNSKCVNVPIKHKPKERRKPRYTGQGASSSLRSSREPGRECSLIKHPMRMFPWEEPGQESTASSEISRLGQNIHSPRQSLLTHQGWHNCSKVLCYITKKGHSGIQMDRKC